MLKLVSFVNKTNECEISDSIASIVTDEEKIQFRIKFEKKITFTIDNGRMQAPIDYML